MEHAHIAAHCCRDSVGPRPMSTWAWIGLGLAAWFAVSLPVGLIIGRMIRVASDEQHRRPPSSSFLVTKNRSGRQGESIRAGSTREQLLSRAFVGVADTLVDDYDVVELLDRLVGYSVELLAADAAGILLVDSQRGLRVVASSNEDAELMELLQLQADQGPCVDCVRTGTQVSVADLDDTAARWPILAAAMTTRGVFQSVQALPLRLRSEAVGAMNLFRRRPGTLPEADLVLGQALADVATIGILSERAIHRGAVLDEQLHAVLSSRALIEEAEGIIAEQSGLSMNAALDRLRHYSRKRHERLSQVARRVVVGDLRPETLDIPTGTAG
jgi:transcriptional regulator with GAF, ATPase, and Fis domain